MAKSRNYTEIEMCAADLYRALKNECVKDQSSTPVELGAARKLLSHLQGFIGTQLGTEQERAWVQGTIQ